MEKQAAIRRVRIAVSIFFGVLTVALCVLWVRSYQNGTVFPGSFRLVGKHYGFVGYRSGRLGLATFDVQLEAIKTPDSFTTQNGFDNFFSGASFKLDCTADQCALSLPFWFVILAVGSIAGLPWISYRFSLRTMLIATTLVAVVLGLGVWMAR